MMNVRCPWCGSTTQVKMFNEYLSAKERIDKEYQCGCGCHFVATHDLTGDIAKIQIKKVEKND